MGLFSRNKHETTPLIVPQSETTARIMATIEHLQLDQDEVVLVGSAALVLYGATLGQYDPIKDQYTERPGDVDFAASPEYMQKVFAEGAPSGTKPSRKDVHNNQTVVQIDTPYLSADLITRFQEDRDDLSQYSTKFRQRLGKHSRPIAGTGYRIATSRSIEEELRRNFSDPKAQQDLAAFNSRPR